MASRIAPGSGRRCAAAAAVLVAAWTIGAGTAAAAPPASDKLIRGTSGPDKVKLGPGNDRYAGGLGNDGINGGKGDDRLAGGPGNDRLAGGPGRDIVRGGPGRDVCVLGALDRARGCEKVRRPPAAGSPAPGSSGPGGGGGGGGTTRPDPAPSDAYLNRNWTPTPYDTCPKALHDSYSVVGPDGKRYPGWHPPVVTDPATGELCSFGHEHGDDPRSSDIYDWVAGKLAAPGYEDRAGIPFGLANEALVAYAAEHPGTPTRFEDHVGHKVSVANDVTLLDEDGHFVEAPKPGRVAGETVRVTCDYLIKLHQGSHSADATANNAHELLYAVKCNDGTQLLSVTLSRFGDPNEFARSCAPGTIVGTGSSSPLPPGIGGTRLLPDRGCVDQFVLVPPSNPAAASDIWALYENWQSENELTMPDGDVIARFDPWFAVRNPSRYYWSTATGSVGRPLDAAWETDSADGGLANRPPWSEVQADDPFEFRDPRSPFDGAQRDFYLRDTKVANGDGPERWYTDPYGQFASRTPFPGSVCQFVVGDNSGQPELKLRLFGRDADYGAGNGVHAPN